MKRQVVAFISLFSLVLVLSVYYVMLPFSTDGVDQVVDTNLESASDVFYENLEETKIDVYEDFVNSQNEIIASASSTNEEKANALQAIADKNKQLELENKVKAELKEIGYEKVYVEMNDETVTIIISKDDATKEDAAKAISAAFKVFGMNKYVEVMFKN